MKATVVACSGARESAQHERAQSRGRDQRAVEEDARQRTRGERRASSGRRGGRRMTSAVRGLDRERQRRERVGHQIQPQQLQRQERQRRPAARRQQHQDLGDVAAEQVEDELADVVEDDAAFFDGGREGLEAVVGRTIAAACLATSVPRMPIATPMSACLSAGASLTPSPIMATISPRGLQRRGRSTQLVLGGDAAEGGDIRPAGRARSRRRAFQLASVERRVRSAPSSPSSRPTASAVSRWSPVSITVRRPACRRRAIVSLTPGAGGSARPTNPRNISPPSAGFGRLAHVP